MALNNSNLIIEKELIQHAAAFEKAIDADVLAFMGPLLFGIDDALKALITKTGKRRKKLAMVLETTGGYVSVVERMVNTMRHHYNHVEFYVPNHALSAGTVLVMSGDAIHMDWYSVLGPIDPQIERPGGAGFLPALGYLIQYDRLIKKSKRGQLTTAEMAFLIEKFDPCELYRYEQERELSIELLREWLARYKFKNWKKTETHHRNVTAVMKKKRATEVATKLNNPARWHSHGRGITMAILRNELNLKIDDFSENPAVGDKLTTYHSLLIDYMMRRNHPCVLHTRDGYTPLFSGE